MTNPEAIERGKRWYEECIRARSSNATLDWQQISTPANGTVEIFSVGMYIDGHLTVLPPVSFAFLETSSDAEIKTFVDGFMDAIVGRR